MDDTRVKLDIKDRYNNIQETYHESRPSPPKVLTKIVTQLAESDKLDLTVDMGCGTGLSTLFWSSISKKVIGFDISENMINYARNNIPENLSNIEFQLCNPESTSIDSGMANLVYISQAIHWMEPELHFEEVNRILAAKGIYLVLNSNLHPLINRPLETPFLRVWKRINTVRSQLGIKNESLKYAIEEHREIVRKSDQFPYLRKIKFCGEESGSLEKLHHLINSIGMVNVLRQNGATDEDLGIDTFNKEVQELNVKEFSMFFFFEGFIAQKL